MDKPASNCGTGWTEEAKEQELQYTKHTWLGRLEPTCRASFHTFLMATDEVVGEGSLVLLLPVSSHFLVLLNCQREIIQQIAKYLEASWTNQTRPIHFEIILLGSRQSGKSSIASQFLYQRKPEFLDSSRYFKVGSCECDGQKIAFQLWDHPGDSHVSYIERIYKFSGRIFVFNICNRPSFEEIEYFRSYYERNIHSQQNVVVTLVIGTRKDLHENRQVSYEEAKAYCDKFRYPYFEVDCTTHVDLEEPFNIFFRKILLKQAQGFVPRRII